MLCDRKVWTLDNRRVADLKMFQALQQDKTVWAPCVIRSPDTKFWRKRDTLRDGLGIRFREGVSTHLGAAIFNPAAQGKNALGRVAELIVAAGRKGVGVRARVGVGVGEWIGVGAGAPIVVITLSYPTITTRDMPG